MTSCEQAEASSRTFAGGVQQGGHGLVVDLDPRTRTRYDEAGALTGDPRARMNPAPIDRKLSVGQRFGAPATRGPSPARCHGRRRRLIIAAASLPALRSASTTIRPRRTVTGLASSCSDATRASGLTGTSAVPARCRAERNTSATALSTSGSSSPRTNGLASRSPHDGVTKADPARQRPASRHMTATAIVLHGRANQRQPLRKP